MCEYFCIGFIDLLLKRKSYLECSIFFTKWIKKKKKKINDIIFSITWNINFFLCLDSKKVKMKKTSCIKCNKYRKIKDFRI